MKKFVATLLILFAGITALWFGIARPMLEEKRIEKCKSELLITEWDRCN